MFAAPAAIQTAYLMTKTKSMYLALIVVLLSPMVANAVPIFESFEDDTANSTSFSEGIFDFTSTGDLFVEFGVGLGADFSTQWLGSGFGDGGSFVSFGSFSITSGSFTIDSGVFWTSDDDGFDFSVGDIDFVGLLSAGGEVTVTINIAPTGDLPDGYVNVSFAGTALDGVSLSGMRFDIPGSLNYLLIDNLSLNATASVPEPGTFALFGLGLAGIGLMRRRRKV